MFESSRALHPFTLQLVQLTGNPALLGAEQVAWRFMGGGVHVVAGGNGSGKSLLCAAVRAAATPTHTRELQESLREAGLTEIALLGQMGEARVEWSLDLMTGLTTWRPAANGNGLPSTPFETLHEDAAAVGPTPHLVVNGDWLIPGTAQLAWAERMVCQPLLRERDAWQLRREQLEAGVEGRPGRVAMHEALDELDARLDMVRESKMELEQMEARALELRNQIGEAEMARQIAAAEETELVAKVELAERVVHLENWAAELGQSWTAAEGVRERFAELQERLEELQQQTRGLPDQAIALAQEYAQLEQQRAIAEAQARDLHDRVLRLTEEKNALAGRLSEIETTIEASEAAPAEQEARTGIERCERELTDLSRRRIDLVRRREGIELQRQERFRELLQLSPDEWNALESYLNSAAQAAQSDSGEHEARRQERARIAERLGHDFVGFDHLGRNTRERLDRLFAIRETVAAREAELAQLRSRIVALQTRPRGNGLKSVLAVVGAGAAGFPVGALLGKDIGFFAAVIGGGLGYGLAALMLPSQDADTSSVLKSRLESLMPMQQEDLHKREVLRLEVGPLGECLTLEAAVDRWQEFQLLAGMLRSLDEELSKAPVEHEPVQVPAILRRLERDEMRRRVDEFRELSRQLTEADREWEHFTNEHGSADRVAALEAQLGELRAALGQAELQRQQAARQANATAATVRGDIGRLEQELRSVSDGSAELATLNDLTDRMSRLDAQVQQAFSMRGAQSVVDALTERAELQRDLRETKSRLSSEHPPQELAIRTRVIEEELRQLTERLQEIDPLFATLESRAEGLEKYREQMQVLFQMATNHEQRAAELKHELAALGTEDRRAALADLPDEDTLTRERSEVQGRLDELDCSIHAARNMADALTVELAELHGSARERVMGAIQTTLTDAIGERFAGIEWTDGEWRVVQEDGQRRGLNTLSRGIAELVILCINAGLLVASTEAEGCPVLWDDVLAQLDDHYLSVARGVIEKLARSRQVVLLTRDARMRAWGRPVEVLAGRYRPDALIS